MTFIVMHFRADSNILKSINRAVKGTRSLLDVEKNQQQQQQKRLLL